MNGNVEKVIATLPQSLHAEKKHLSLVQVPASSDVALPLGKALPLNGTIPPPANASGGLGAGSPKVSASLLVFNMWSKVFFFTAICLSSEEPTRGNGPVTQA